jgi:hypothetical protein
VLAYYSESETPTIAVSNSDVKEHVLHLSFASRKTMVVKRTGLVLRQGSRNSYKHHIMLRVNGKSRRFDMQRLLFVGKFPSEITRERSTTSEVMVPLSSAAITAQFVGR